MHLDLPTLAAMGSFVAVCAGVILLVAASQTQTTPGVAVWGIANIVAGIGIFCLMLGSAIGWPSTSIFGGMLLALSQGLVWKAARTLDAHPAPFLLALLGGLIVVAGSIVPALPTVMGSLGLAAGATYLLAAATSLWLGREERLPARWPLIFLLAAHACVLLLGLYSTLRAYLVSSILRVSFSLWDVPCSFSLSSRSARRQPAERPQILTRSLGSRIALHSWNVPSASWSGASGMARRCV
jgi:hypothetical protein